MNKGRAFEIFVRYILQSIGFMSVKSDGMVIYDDSCGQMIQGLGYSHNADVLLEPPVQIPLYTRSRLLVECKNYNKKIGIGVIRGALGLREDINHFTIVDKGELKARIRKRNNTIMVDRISYQVAVASMSGFSLPAQKYAAVHRISLLGFEKYFFWNEVEAVLSDSDATETDIYRCVDSISSKLALAVTNTGQLLLLYKRDGDINLKGDKYEIHYNQLDKPWILRVGKEEYEFQLPNYMIYDWINKNKDEIKMRKNIYNDKMTLMSNMAVYYIDDGYPRIKLLSINKETMEQIMLR